MKKLKVYTFSAMERIGLADYYLKSEADKVISELNQRLASVNLALRLNQPEALYSDLETMGRLSHEIGVVARRERHQKYKRCLAMAERCEYRLMALEKMLDTDYRLKKIQLSRRWWVKWLELADTFKGAK